AERDSADQPWPDSENVPVEPWRRVVKPPEEFAEVDEHEDYAREEDDEGHYAPPPPPPLPKLDLPAKLAWLSLFGRTAYLLYSSLIGWNLEGWVLFTAVAAFIGGFVALVVRMGDGPPNDSGWDDGARL